MPFPYRLAPHAALASMLAIALASGAALSLFLPLPNADEEFNSPGFVVRHAWTKFAFLATEPFRPEATEADDTAKVARFFELNSRIAEAERIAGNPAADADKAAAARDGLDALYAERRGLENTVEAILSGRLTEVAHDAGLTRRIGGNFVWPPVAIEFEEPPSVLVTSPRAEIRKDGQSLLQGDLPLVRIQRIEARAERDGATSALVVHLGGIAMYPAIIPSSGDYRATLQDIAHEWLHHYLYFTPLGRHYFDRAELTTLNETVANMGGRELGEMIFERYPLPESAPSDATASASSNPAPDIDFTAEMRGLRREVEMLLAAGQIDEAERVMEEKRRYLADHGHYIRRLNQAYFAFHGSYADSPASIDPIGPKLNTLRERSASLREFLRAAQEFTSEEELDDALEPR